CLVAGCTPSTTLAPPRQVSETTPPIEEAPTDVPRPVVSMPRTPVVPVPTSVPVNPGPTELPAIPTSSTPLSTAVVVAAPSERELMVPLYRQQHALSCEAAALRMAMGALGRTV